MDKAKVLAMKRLAKQEAIEKIRSEELKNKVKEYIEMKNKVQKMQSERELKKVVRRQNRDETRFFKKRINEIMTAQNNVGSVEKKVFLQHEVDKLLL